MESLQYTTAGGLRVTRRDAPLPAADAFDALARSLDERRGLLLASSYEYPGRYKRYDIGFVDPPLVIEARGRRVTLEALNTRGELLLRACDRALEVCAEIRVIERSARRIAAEVPATTEPFSEEARTRTPTVFSALRAVQRAFASFEDTFLGLYGAFGYDLVFQFEALREVRPRAATQRDLVLYLPDRILVADHDRQQAREYAYDVEFDGESTEVLGRERVAAPFVSTPGGGQLARDHAPGEFARSVERARVAFADGDLFEVTPSQVFSQPCPATPSVVFDALRRANPAPYGFLVNLGASEFLVGASPEMYVRVRGRRVETCPIAGTIARGSDAFGDARQILALLSSDKDEAELTMCTDVDRNDKARICEPGSVRVIGRRQVELYSRLIHTVDHVEGTLREGYDGLDAFITHLWAVTLTGAPKLDAMQFIETHEKSSRGYYGGAVGAIGFDGSVNTGLVLRTLQIREGVAHLRAGATLHFDSDPAAEECETELKASALVGVLEAVRAAETQRRGEGAVAVEATARQVRGAAVSKTARLPVLVIDHRDSFVHTLGDYFRQSGCDVTTLRYGFASSELDRLVPSLVVLSPGPARPEDFGMRATLAELARREVCVFGVCLGLQGMVEYCGGTLAKLATPMHGKCSTIACDSSRLFDGLPSDLKVGRYHSLHADLSTFPAALKSVATTADGCVMAIEHITRPWSAVQFHPESILSAESNYGLKLIENVVGWAAELRFASTR